MLHHPTSMPACTVGLGASHPPVGSQCWNTGKQQSLIPPCTPALLGCLHSPHPISAPVEDMHSTTAALREHPQQPPVSCSHFSQPLCLWDVGQQWDTRTSHSVRLCSTTSAGTPATRGMQWDPSHSRYPHLVGPGKAGRSPCRDPTSPAWDPCSIDQSERLSQQRPPKPPQKHSCAPSAHWHKALPHAAARSQMG